MSPNSLRTQIKEATRPLHERLDAHPLSERLLSPQVSLTDYVRFAKVNFGFLAPIEHALVQYLPLQSVHPFQPRAQDIIVDLQAIGVPTNEIAQIPVMAEFDPVTSIGEAMGVAYVLEGSAMGGLVIAKHLSRTLQLSPEHGLKFFLPHDPKQVVRDFQAFAHKLDTFAGCECDERDAIEGAHRTYQMVRLWMDRQAIV